MATVTSAMQTRITARGAELTGVKTKTGYGYFERHTIIRALCPNWVFANYD